MLAASQVDISKKNYVKRIASTFATSNEEKGERKKEKSK